MHKSIYIFLFQMNLKKKKKLQDLAELSLIGILQLLETLQNWNPYFNR